MRTIECPECDEAIEVESGMEGRRVACPECGEKFTVPERKKAGAKKKRPAKAAGPNWGLIGTVVALVLVVGGVAAYFATRKKPAAPVETAGKGGDAPAPTGGGDTPFKLNLPIPGVKGAEVPSTPPAEPPPPPVPQGWGRYTLPEANLSAHLPSPPSDIEKTTSDMSVRVENRKWYVELPNGAGEFSLDAMMTAPGTTLDREQEGVFFRYPRHALERQAKARFVAERAASFGSFKATELEYALPTGDPVVVRYGFVRSGDRLMFVVAVAGGKGISPAERAAFFDSIRAAK